MERQLKVYMLFVVTLVTLFNQAQADTATVPCPERPPGYCAYQGRHRIGTSWFKRDCTMYRCVKSRGTTFVDITGCPKTRAPPGCVLKEGPGRYPACCPKPVCPNRQFFPYEIAPYYADMVYE